jgi:hypothetical protein
MSMRTITCTLLASALLFSACGTDEAGSQTKDSLSAKDSVKKEITESLPPDEDFKQFEWIYSSFVASATYNVKSTDVFIDKETGLWVITTNGAMPQMVHVNSVQGILNHKNDTLIPIDRMEMVCALKNEEIPQPDCDQTSLWSKSGCFTSEHNTFKEDRIWEHAGLTDNDAKNVEETASKIGRVVINTALNMRMYFMLKNGAWYLVFLDLRVPCSA